MKFATSWKEGRWKRLREVIRGLVKRRIVRFHSKNRGSLSRTRRFQFRSSSFFSFFLLFFLFSNLWFQEREGEIRLKIHRGIALLKGEAHFPRKSRWQWVWTSLFHRPLNFRLRAALFHPRRRLSGASREIELSRRRRRRRGQDFSVRKRAGTRREYLAKGGTPLTVFKASRPHRRRGNVSGITFAVFFRCYSAFLQFPKLKLLIIFLDATSYFAYTFRIFVAENRHF